LLEADPLRDGGFSVVVAGQRYGKESSREHSPAAEKLATQLLPEPRLK